jgi:hypothetical protein
MKAQHAASCTCSTTSISATYAVTITFTSGARSLLVGVTPRACNDRKSMMVKLKSITKYAQLIYLVASGGGKALRQNREAGPAVDRVDQPQAEVVAQMGMDGGMSRACRWMAHLRTGGGIHG